MDNKVREQTQVRHVIVPEKKTLHVERKVGVAVRVNEALVVPGSIIFIFGVDFIFLTIVLENDLKLFYAHADLICQNLKLIINKNI